MKIFVVVEVQGQTAQEHIYIHLQQKAWFSREKWRRVRYHSIVLVWVAIVVHYLYWWTANPQVCKFVEVGEGSNWLDMRTMNCLILVSQKRKFSRRASLHIIINWRQRLRHVLKTRVDPQNPAQRPWTQHVQLSYLLTTTMGGPIANSLIVSKDDVIFCHRLWQSFDLYDLRTLTVLWGHFWCSMTMVCVQIDQHVFNVSEFRGFANLSTHRTKISKPQLSLISEIVCIFLNLGEV